VLHRPGVERIPAVAAVLDVLRRPGLA
jgi:hypothetical protein